MNALVENDDHSEFTQDSSALDSFFLNTVEDSLNSKYWTATIDVNGLEVSFKLDTGAEVTAITEKSLELVGSPKLNQPTRNLCGPNRQPLSVRGSLSAHLHQGQYSCTHEVFVVKHLSQNLLGLPAIKDLHLLTIVNRLQVDFATGIQNQFPSLFTGLSTLQSEYEICLKPNVLPYCLGTVRNISLPIHNEVKEKLAEMEAQGVISKVQQPTSWCAGMVVVKRNTCLRRS